MRQKIVAGNWKMNTTPAEGAALARQIAKRISHLDRATVILCPPATHLMLLADLLHGSKVEVGAQNVHWETAGAFTGELSAEMILATGARWAIIGHSERRRYFGESDESVNRRAAKSLQAGLRPIICIGETLEERETNRTFEVLERQILIGLKGLELAGDGGLVIAYEPVWAIGTGLAATAEDANAIHRDVVRPALTEMFGDEVAQGIRIQYGGSVTPENAAGFFSQSDIDGALVGGASLKAESFAAIARAAAGA